MFSAETWLALSHPLVVTTVGCTILIIWHYDVSRPNYLLLFGLAYLAYSVAVTLQISVVPDILAVNVLLSGILYMMAVVLLTHGLIALSGGTYSYLLPVLIISVMLVGRLYFVVIDDHPKLRFYLLHVAIIIVLLHGAFLARHLLKGRPAEKVLYVSFLLLALSHAPRTLLAWTRPADLYGFDLSTYWLITQASVYLFSITFGLALILTIMQKRIVTHQALSETDVLTGLRNRRGFFETALRIINRIDHYTILIADIDRFKKVNDTYGHLFGDTVLADTATIIEASLRPGDVSGRIGGEEFAILLPDTSVQDGHQVAERLRQNFENFTFGQGKAKLRCTISLGFASFPSAMPLNEALLHADRLLYQAKAQGRNRVVSSTESDIMDSVISLPS